MVEGAQAGRPAGVRRVPAGGPDVPIKLVHKMSETQVLKEMAPHPLRHVKTLGDLPWQHVIVFEKKADKGASAPGSDRHGDATPRPHRPRRLPHGPGPRGAGPAGVHQPRPRRRPAARDYDSAAMAAQRPRACSTPPGRRRALLRRRPLLRPGRGVPGVVAAPRGASPRRASRSASKWGYTYTAGWQVEAEKHEVKDHSLAVLRRQVAESRALLGGHLDLYQIHSATLESGVLDDRAVLDELARLRAGGLADRPVAERPAAGGDAAAGAGRRRRRASALFDAVQATWNLLEPSAGPALAEAHAAGVGVIVKEALANGRLTARNDDPAFAGTAPAAGRGRGPAGDDARRPGLGGGAGPAVGRRGAERGGDGRSSCGRTSGRWRCGGTRRRQEVAAAGGAAGGVLGDARRAARGTDAGWNGVNDQRFVTWSPAWPRLRREATAILRLSVPDAPTRIPAEIHMSAALGLLVLCRRDPPPGPGRGAGRPVRRQGHRQVVHVPAGPRQGQGSARQLHHPRRHPPDLGAGLRRAGHARRVCRLRGPA